jgi:hypothetical protein
LIDFSYQSRAKRLQTGFERRSEMLDVLYIVTTLVFFAVSAAFMRRCDRLLREEADE